MILPVPSKTDWLWDNDKAVVSGSLLRLERGTTNSPGAFTYIAHAHVVSTEIFPVHWSPQIQPLLLCGCGLSHLTWMYDSNSGMCDSNFVWSFILCLVQGKRVYLLATSFEASPIVLLLGSPLIPSWKVGFPVYGARCEQALGSIRQSTIAASMSTTTPSVLRHHCNSGELVCKDHERYMSPSESHSWAWESPLFHYTHKRRNEWIKLL